MSEIPQHIKLQIGADGIAELKFHPNKNILVIGTVEGRVRIYDCNKSSPEELFRKKWHKNLSRLAVSKTGCEILTSSNQGCIKEHDFEYGKETWSNLNAHQEGISAIIYQTAKTWISADDSSILKFWDSRQQDPVCEMNICAPNDECDDESVLMSHNSHYLSSVNALVLDDNGRHLFAAMDDGTLVTINPKKRKVELRSETLAFSAKSIVTFKNQSKLGIATDEGVISIFNWNQFGNLSDRFPVVKKSQQIETMIKLDENVVLVGTNKGAIKAVSLLPNCVLSDIGLQEFPVGNEGCGDCMTLDTNFTHNIVASGCPESNIVCFFSTEKATEEFSILLQDRSENKRKNSGNLKEVRKRRKIEEDDGFLDGLCQVSKIDENSDDDEDRDSDDDENEDSNDSEEIDSIEESTGVESDN